MKQTLSIVRNFALTVLSVSFLLVACSKKDDQATVPTAPFAGSYVVTDDDDSYTLKIENTGGNNFNIRGFGGFLNVPLKSVAEGKTLKIPSQTFTNPSGKSITIVGNGTLSTKNTPDDMISFQYDLTGYAAHSGSFVAIRK